MNEYSVTILMPTSIHVPKPLLEAVDRRARSLAISRNRLVVLALEKELARATEWSPGFFERLARVEPDEAATVDDMISSIRAASTRKRPPRL